jgi:hypothetical protein
MGYGFFSISSEVKNDSFPKVLIMVYHTLCFMGIVHCVMLKNNETVHFRDSTGSHAEAKNKVKTYSVGPNS